MVRALAGTVLLLVAGAARADGPFGVDHRVAVSDSGIWARHDTLGLEYGVVALELGGALWFGGDTQPGRTLWQSVDATVFGQVAAQAAKFAFGRERPSQTGDPDQWFHGLHAQSFPSGEVTLQASAVTPVLMQYAGEHPWVWALEVLPAYDAVARVKEGAHWQSDVIAGWALGTAFGVWAAQRPTPILLSVLPHGFRIGLQARF